MTQHSQSHSLIKRHYSDQTHFIVSPQCFGTFHPRVFLAILLALVALTHTGLAQKVETNLYSIPQLKILYMIPNAGGYYIPDFDTVNNGRNAFIASDFPYRVNYARFIGDTANFWKEGFPTIGLDLYSADLDGDGIKELIDSRKKIYTTKRKGIPHSDTKVQVANQYKANDIVESVRDYDGDGREDIIYRTDDSSYAVMWGQEKFTDLKLSPAQLPKNVVTAFGTTINPSLVNTARIGVFTVGKNSYYMYTSWATINQHSRYGVVYICLMKRVGDTLKATIQDSIYGYKEYPERPIIGGTLRQDIASGKVYWNTHEVIGIKSNQEEIYRDYTFEMQEDGSWLDVPPPTVGPIRIRELGKPDVFHWLKKFLLDSTKSPHIYAIGLYSEYPRDGVLPYCRTFGDFTGVESIYDVDGDGVSDWAYSDGELYITKGIDWRKPVSVEQDENTMNVSLVPNEVSRTGKVLLRFTTIANRELRVELYSMDGRIVGSLFEGTVESGNVELPLFLTKIQIAAGRYMVKLTAGVQSASVPLLIQP